MTAQSAGGASSAQHALRFRLPYGWYPLLVDGTVRPEATGARAAPAAASEGADRDAFQRCVSLQRDAIDRARSAGAVAMFRIERVTRTVRFPATLTVIESGSFRISPSAGAGSGAVAAALRESFAILDAAPLGDGQGRERDGPAAVLPGPPSEMVKTGDSTALRRIRTVRIEGFGRLRSLIVDYWVVVPGTKGVVLATFSTPLADIPRIVVGYFDEIMRGSFFEPLG